MNFIHNDMVCQTLKFLVTETTLLALMVAGYACTCTHKGR